MTILVTGGGGGAESQPLGTESKKEAHQYIPSKLQSDQIACPLGSQVLQLETTALHHQLHLLLLGAGCLLPAQHVL